MPVDMRAKPYYLDDEAVQWVEDTIASMSLEEKIGQLFFNMGSSRTEEYLKMTVDKYHHRRYPLQPRHRGRGA